ncbi:MAG: hypothetical protein CSA66_04355, partial [Proteobacteria bacterium]
MALKRLRETAEAAPEDRGALAARAFERHAKLADKAFKTLGDMKGVALKAGQMLSYMDGAIPAEYADVYQQVLERLQQSAPALRWSTIRPTLEAEIGPLGEVFAKIDEAPFAAASIGQVHRAERLDGRVVAVKVQYPGVAKAMSSDLKNAELFHALLTPFMGIMGANRKTRRYIKAIMEELEARLLEELDYEREAAMQTRFRELLADEPDVVIPEVHADLSTGRVLVSELVRGRTLSEVCETAPQRERDRYGQILARVMLRCLYELGLFNADPHPGNYLFPADGRVCLLDFGCVKEIPPWMRRDMLDYVTDAIIATRTDAPEDWARFDVTLGKALHLDGSDPLVFRLYREFSLYIMRPALHDAPFDFTSAYTKESIDRVLDGAKEAIFAGRKIPRLPDLPPVPPDYTMLNRLQWG